MNNFFVWELSREVSQLCCIICVRYELEHVQNDMFDADVNDWVKGGFCHGLWTNSVLVRCNMTPSKS